ncbi:MAG: polymer-forming cytoskeletal protein [Candidatus Zixiibacteriota bacterium]
MRANLLIYVLPFLLLCPVLGQDTERQTFVSISHTVDHTIAKDSSGQTYYYNRTTGEFDSAEAFQGNTPFQQEAGDYGDEKVILPPEKRCTDVTYGDVTKFFDNVEIGIDERIEGSVFSFQDIVVHGLVTKDVVSLRTVTVSGTGEIRGDVIAKDIRRERGGKILGQRQEVPFPDVLSMSFPQIGYIAASGYHFLILFIFLFIAIIIAAIAPKPLGRIVNRLSNSLVASFFWGLFFWIALVPILILLIITIVGLPLIIVYIFAIPIAILLGYAAAAQAIGEMVCHRFGWHQKSMYMRISCGVIALEVPHLFYMLFLALGLQSLASLMLIIYLIIGTLALTIGIGAAVAAKFGVKPKQRTVEVHMYQTPPPPPTPGVVPPPPPHTSPAPPPPTPPPPPKRDDEPDIV